MLLKMANGKTYWLELGSLALLTLGFLALLASITDGIPAIVVAMLIFIYEIMRYPYPVLSQASEEGEGGDDDSGMGTV